MVATSALYQQIARQKESRPPSEFLCALFVLSPALPWLALVWTLVIFMWRLHLVASGCPLCIVQVSVPDVWRIDIPAVEALTRTALVIVPTFLVHAVVVMFTSVLGLLAALVCWVLLAVVLRARLTRAEQFDDGAYTALVARLNALHSKLDGLHHAYSGHPAYRATADLAELSEVRLRTCGAHWSSGSGYTEVERLIDQAEEALIPIEPTVSVIEGACRDLLRLQNSTINDASENALRQTVLDAVAALSPRTACYMRGLAGACSGAADAAGVPRNGEAAAPAAPAGEAAGATPDVAASIELMLENEGRPWESPLGDAQRAARIALRSVRHTLNAFRDERREALAAVRAHARRALLAVALILFLVVANTIDFYLLFRLTQPAAPDAMPMDARISLAAGVAAVVYYFLVGVLMGFLPQLRDAQRGETPAGLVDAAPLLTLGVSGLAAVGGVILVHAATADFRVLGPVISTVGDSHPFGGDRLLGWMIVAALFGLAPGRLLDGLQRYTGALQRDLQKTEAAPTPAGSTGTSPAAGGARP